MSGCNRNFRSQDVRSQDVRRQDVRTQGVRSQDVRSQGVRNRYINVSSDGESLVYSQLGGKSIGEASLVDEVSKSLKILGEYSEDSEKKFVNDRSYLSFLLPKYLPDKYNKKKFVDINLDVSQSGIKSYSGSGKQDFDNFLTWIVNNVKIFQNEINMNDNLENGGQFVMMKNVLSSFVATPYRFGSSYKFYAISVNGVVYLMKDYKIMDDQIGMWAHKFEQFMTEEDTSKEVVCNENFRAVLSCNLGPHKLMYSASLDCANPEEFEEDFTNLSAFVHLKCCKGENYRFVESLKWYMDYIFSGVPKVLVGQRDDEGMVSQLQLFEVEDILRMGQGKWEAVNSIVFASELLSFIKSRVESDPGAVFCIKKVSRRAEIFCVKEPDVDNFLPAWFQNNIMETTDVKASKEEE